MKFLVFLMALSFSTSHALIYDCFTFSNELDLLEIRLHELDGQVDYFVLVESDTTFQGNSKSLSFELNQHRFRQFLDKIIHVVVDDMPVTNNPWDRERHQRDAIIRGLDRATDEDVLIVSDVDEIPSRECIERVRSIYLPHQMNPIALEIDFRIFWLNVETEDVTIRKIANPVVCRFRHLKQVGAEHVRAYRGDYEVWPECGWHFTNAGGEFSVDFFINKLQSFSHAECNTGVFDRVGIEEIIKRYGHRVPDDASFPHFVRDHWEFFIQKMYIRPPDHKLDE